MLKVALQHNFGGFTLDVGFTVREGITTLFGTSGSGKTSVINAVAGLLQPDKGNIQLNDQTLLDTTRAYQIPPHQRQIGYIFQEDRLFPHMNVAANLQFGSRYNKSVKSTSDKQNLNAIIELLGIGHLLERSVVNLSGGERQRVAIGRAVMAKPKLLLADEPLAALDEQRKAELLPYFERLRDELGIPVLYVSHAPTEVARLSNTVIVLDQGRVIAQGSPQDVLANPSLAPIGVNEIGAVLTAKIAQHHADGLTELDANGITLLVPQIEADHGTDVRVRIPAQEVMLSLSSPTDISALNVIPATVTELEDQSDLSVVVALQTQAGQLLARVTQRSAQKLQLQPGTGCCAIVKTVAIAQR